MRSAWGSVYHEVISLSICFPFFSFLTEVTESHVHNIFAVKLADSSHQGELLGFPSICKVHYKSL